MIVRAHNDRSGMTRFLFPLFLAPLIFIGLPSGCAPRPVQPITVEMIYRTVDRTSDDRRTRDSSCRVGIVEILDERSNKENLGYAPVPIFGSGLIEWAHAGFSSLTDYGHEVDDPATLDDIIGGELNIEIALTRVFCRSQPTTLRGVVVMSVRFDGPTGTLGQRVYRGDSVIQKSFFFTKSDSKFGERAILQALNGAMDDALSKVELDLRDLCSGS